MRPLRPGFSLIELLIALVITSILGTITSVALAHHHRVLRYSTNTLSSRDLLRETADLLTTELRSTPATANAFPFASDTAIEFFSTLGASTLCETPNTPYLPLPPDTLANDAILTTWIAQPDSNDAVLIYHDSTALTPNRGWLQFPIVSITKTQSQIACPSSSGFTSPSDAPRTAYVLSLPTTPPLTIRKGAPIRFLRRSRYNIYRASDSFWYLGFRRCHATTGVCDGVQPVAGPYSNSKTPPLTFRYHTTSGFVPSPDGPITDLTRIEVTIRTTPKRYVPHSTARTHSDSALVLITLRNRP